MGGPPRVSSKRRIINASRKRRLRFLQLEPGGGAARTGLRAAEDWSRVDRSRRTAEGCDFSIKSRMKKSNPSIERHRVCLKTSRYCDTDGAS